ncbi:TrbG/VirB9 family P-type conjugative transfer protein [Sphingomonas sp. DG1-23]|uniref:TrbG/VirB9 family P-type conjugative transfer protein n=1 Tax=Sphingomonas sp. DG1-23 TaxID=3068316 RepID=UPI00273F3B8B|nr:TrbG/VirB9 family P-type conjugative transfer protein [Sphingomonas sp. DG1-23]MDP5278250.1 TrbG/VirB9 family P-type conjugative transfer protein [Sphingomonas sp. DG1-23]
MRHATVVALFAVASASPALAWQDMPGMPGATGTRVRNVDYVADQVVRIEAAAGYQLMLELAPDESIENVAVGDSGAWQVTANKRGNRLFIKPIQAGITTNMVVITDVRLYSFELVPLPGPQPDTAYSVRFRYPAPGSSGAPSKDAEPTAGRYKMGGDASLRPSGMHDDGVHTYIEWPEDRALPAIYAVDANGKEMLVNGMMRDGRMVIDSIQERLVFRVDKHRATAVRVAPDRR